MKEVYLGTNFYICLIEVPRDLCSQMFCVLGLDLFSTIDNTALEVSKISRVAASWYNVINSFIQTILSGKLHRGEKVEMQYRYLQFYISIIMN